MSGQAFQLTPGTLTLAQLRDLVEHARPIVLDPASHAAIDRSAAVVQAVIDRGETAYGINTGFGALAKTHIKDDQLTELQRRLVVSHAAGTGVPLGDDVVRAILILKVNALARGFSGIRRSVIEALVALINAEVYPLIPAKGSVGASGDLAPLAHMSAALLGIGEVRRRGKVMPATEGLKFAGLAPIDLAAKEGLALLNGTQASTALAALGLFKADDLLRSGLIAGAMSTDAALGSDAPFDPRIHAVRGQLGQIAAAEALKALMAGSPLRASHVDCDRVQDPYSLRCQPQVMGAALDMLRFAAQMIEREGNAVSDNPLVFAEQGDIVSGGNFHAEPVAMAADCIAIALSEIGAISERRVALLTDSRMSNLPAFLSPDPGLNSGFMIAHVTAAALASENKMLAHPASVDSLPTSANQEDHVSMATHGARRLHDIADNVAAILGIEMLAAGQGIDLRRPVETSPKLKQVMALLRKDTKFWDQDRMMAPEIEAAKKVALDPALRALVALSAF
jgi:histidine ammonia-lyase